MTNNERKSFFETPGWLIINGIFTCAGAIFSMLGVVLSETIPYSGRLAIIGLLILGTGLVFIIRYARRANKINEIERTTMKNQIEENQQTISAMQTEINNLQVQLNTYEKTHNLLVAQANNGMKHTFNSVRIHFDEEKKLYAFDFEKKFQIISELVPVRYEAQFYANKLLGKSVQEIKGFYGKPENKIEWTALEVQAFISYEYVKRNGNKVSQKQIKLSINSMNENGFLIPFDICFSKHDNNALIELPKGAEVTLKYCYKVPVRLWGNYINRTLSYFNEQTKVYIVYSKDKKLESLEVSKLLPDGSPATMSEDENLSDDNTYKITSSNGTQNEIEVEIKGVRFGRYRVMWDSRAYFGGEEVAIKNGKDNTELARR